MTWNQVHLFKLKERGAIVERVSCGALNNGDVILSLNGQPVHSRKEVETAIASVAPGDTFNAHVFRVGHEYDVALERAAGMESTKEMEHSAKSGATGVLGIQVESRQDGSSGVVISNVETGKPAAVAGLQQGDVILEVNSHSLNSPEDNSKQTWQRSNLSLVV